MRHDTGYVKITVVMSAPVSVDDVIKAVETVASPGLKYMDDPTGFQVGDRSMSVERVLFCLEVTESVVEEAVDNDVAMLVSHHPLVYKPLTSLDTSSHLSRMLMMLVKEDISVYTAHTSLDRARWGVSDALAEVLGVEKTEVLVPANDVKHFKIVVFIPTKSVEAVTEAISRAGAGEIGDYTHCTFRSPGTGTFLPREEAKPYSGEVGKLNEEQEVRLETVVPASKLGVAVSAILASHPYEEVAYDVYRVENPEPGVGFGRIGVLPEALPLGKCAERWSKALGARVRVEGDLKSTVKRVAVCGGSGGDLLSAVAGKGADVYVTGDVKHHTAVEAKGLGLAIVDAGHYETEAPVVPGFARRVDEILRAEGREVGVLVSKVKTSPWT